MQNIELYFYTNWSNIDGDGYESDYIVSDEEHDIIVDLAKKYAAEKGTKGIDARDFTDDYFAKNAPELYKQIEDDAKEEMMASTLESAEDWFDEEEEECTIEEYINNYCSMGFYFTDDFLKTIV